MLRWVCGALMVLTLTTLTQAQPGGAAAFVRSLYEHEIARNADAATGGVQEFEALFTPHLRALRAAPSSPAAPFVAGPKLHAFFGWGMLPGVPVALLSVSEGTGGTAQSTVVTVGLTVRGSLRSVEVRLRQTGGKWLISNISYDSGDDMVTFYRKRSGQ